MTTPSNIFTLAHWRYTVANLYAHVRQCSEDDPAQAWQSFLAARNELFRSHPQTPLTPEQIEQRSELPYYPYNPAYRVLGLVNHKVERETFTVDLGVDGLFRYTRAARVDFNLKQQAATLYLYWIEGYGGGLFLPFQDATSGEATYGGGRYLYDTIKGADLGTSYLDAAVNTLLLDFNYAYNPSCAYNPQWVCPLSPAENRLTFPVEAGEKYVCVLP